MSKKVYDEATSAIIRVYNKTVEDINFNSSDYINITYGILTVIKNLCSEKEYVEIQNFRDEFILRFRRFRRELKPL